MENRNFLTLQNELSKSKEDVERVMREGKKLEGSLYERLKSLEGVHSNHTEQMNDLFAILGLNKDLAGLLAKAELSQKLVSVNIHVMNIKNSATEPQAEDIANALFVKDSTARLVKDFQELKGKVDTLKLVSRPMTDSNYGMFHQDKSKAQEDMTNRFTKK